MQGSICQATPVAIATFNVHLGKEAKMLLVLVGQYKQHLLFIDAKKIIIIEAMRSHAHDLKRSIRCASQ